MPRQRTSQTRREKRELLKLHLWRHMKLKALKRLDALQRPRPGSPRQDSAMSFLSSQSPSQSCTPLDMNRCESKFVCTGL